MIETLSPVILGVRREMVGAPHELTTVTDLEAEAVWPSDWWVVAVTVYAPAVL